MFEVFELDLFEIDVTLRKFRRVLRGVPVKRRVHMDLQRVHIISIQNPRRVDAIQRAENPRRGQAMLAIDTHLEPRLGIINR
jgi:epoxyqueuosine reductase QueG